MSHGAPTDASRHASQCCVSHIRIRCGQQAQTNLANLASARRATAKTSLNKSRRWAAKLSTSARSSAPPSAPSLHSRFFCYCLLNFPRRVCKYVYMSVIIYVYTFKFVEYSECIHTHMFICYMYVYIRTRIHAHTRIHPHILCNTANEYTHIGLHTYMYIYSSQSISISKYIYIYTY